MPTFKPTAGKEEELGDRLQSAIAHSGWQEGEKGFRFFQKTLPVLSECN